MGWRARAAGRPGRPVGTGQPTLRVEALTVGGGSADRAVMSDGAPLADRSSPRPRARGTRGLRLPRRKDRGARYEGEGGNCVGAERGHRVRVIRDGRPPRYAGTLDTVSVDGPRRGIGKKWRFGTSTMGGRPKPPARANDSDMGTTRCRGTPIEIGPARSWTPDAGRRTRIASTPPTTPRLG